MKADFKLLKVKDFMKTQVVSLDADTSLFEAVKIFLSHQISSAPVVKENGDKLQIIGFLSEIDLLDALAKSEYHNQNPDIPVTELMRIDILSVESQCDIFTLEEKFSKYQLKHLPVTQDGHLIGYVSRHDCLQAALEQYQHITGAKIREKQPFDLANFKDRYQAINVKFL